MYYIATFHTHYGAMQFHQFLIKKGQLASRLMPVPRNLSASCGVCVKFPIEAQDLWLDQEDLDQVVSSDENHVYKVIYQNK